MNCVAYEIFNVATLVELNSANYTASYIWCV